METCKGKPIFVTEEAAQSEVARLIACARRTGHGGTSWKRLHYYRCGQHFHVGRNNHYAPMKWLPEPKAPSRGELNRRLKRLDEKWDKRRKHLLHEFGKRIEADNLRARQEALAAVGYFSERRN